VQNAKTDTILMALLVSVARKTTLGKIVASVLEDSLVRTVLCAQQAMQVASVARALKDTVGQTAPSALWGSRVRIVLCVYWDILERIVRGTCPRPITPVIAGPMELITLTVAQMKMTKMVLEQQEIAL